MHDVNVEEIHSLEEIELNLRVETHTEQEEAETPRVASATGFLVGSGTGFMIVSPTGFLVG